MIKYQKHQMTVVAASKLCGKNGAGKVPSIAWSAASRHRVAALESVHWSRRAIPR